MTDEQIDELLKALDDMVDGYEAGLACVDETRQIVRDWMNKHAEDIVWEFG